MALHLGSRRFAPSLFATLLTAFGVAITSYLGVWQLSRADEKRALADQFAAGEMSTLELKPAGTEKLPRFQSVTARGEYDSSHQVLLDNMPSASGRPGFRVLTPFELSEHYWILVDRGWVPLGRTRSDLPKIDVEEHQRTITGRIDELPRPGMRLAKAPLAVTNWPHITNFPEHAELEAALGRQLDPRLVVLDASSQDGFALERPQRAGFGPDRHIAYAVQWFALAATMLAVYLLLTLRNEPTP